MEYLTFDEITKNLANKEDICRFQQVSAPPPRYNKGIYMQIIILMFHFYQFISYTNNNCHLVLSFINIYIIL